MSEETGKLVRGLGPVATTALVAGNIIGSGIYVIPASLADAAGPLSLLSWFIVAACFLLLAIVFADLVSAFPISGGPQVYAQHAFGDLVGLTTAFLYWISGVIGNAAFLTAFIGYLQIFLPALGSPVAAFAIAQVFLWTFTAINVWGVRLGGAVQVLTTVVKLVPLLVLSAALLWTGSRANLIPFAPKGYGALLPAISLVAWMFVGAESVTVPAEEVKGEGRTLQRATYVGYGLATAVYLLVAVAVSLGLPSRQIAGSASPLAVAAVQVLGPWGERFITLGALISVMGVLNGWLLVVGRLPFAAARQGLGPAFLARIDPRTGTPIRSLVVSSFLTGALALLYFNRTLLEAYNFIALASTATIMIAIGAACAALVVLSRREGAPFTPAQRRRGPMLGVAGVLVALLMIVGSGWQVCGYTLLATALPVPFHFWLRRKRVSLGRA